MRGREEGREEGGGSEKRRRWQRERSLPTEGRETEQAHKVARFPRSSDPDSVPRTSRGGDRSGERRLSFHSIHDALYLSNATRIVAETRILARSRSITMLPMRSVWPNKRPRVEFGEISISIDIEIVLFFRREKR